MLSTLHPSGKASGPVPAEDARTVLVVDDSRMQRKILTSLAGRWGYRILEADCAEAALRICETQMPDIILSDWVMPGLSGIEFCQRFRNLSKDNYGYFILLTTKSEKEDVAQGLDAGADDFLSKPVHGHELRARIMAGERILQMQRELTDKNRVISETLVELQRLYNALDNDLLEAKKLQQSLVRDRHKAFETGSLSLLLRPSGHVGGDLVGYFPSGDGRVGAFAIDVSGHGVSSALMTARLAGFLSGGSPDQNIALHRLPDGRYAPRSPVAALETLNDLVLNEMETEHYFTMLLADVDLKTGRVVIGQAGHPHPLVQRADGRIEQDGPGGFPVGLMPGAQFSEYEVELAPGDRLLILSDGVSECPGEGGLLGDEGVERMVRDLASVRGPALLEALVWNLAEFCGCRQFPDDISGVLLEFDGADQPK